MSEQAAETTTPPAGEPEHIELPAQGDAAFGALMDALAPETPDEAAAAGGAPAAAAAPGDGSPAAPAEGAAPAGEPAGTATPGAAGEPAVAADAAAGAAAADGAPADGADTGGAGDLPAEWTASASDFQPRLAELSTALEDNTARAYHAEALEAVKTEHAQYFEALSKHPRLLVGTEVPAIGKDGMETLRDAADAREWQDAIKSVLVDEVRDRTSRSIEENSDYLANLHQSIELFQNNPDLIPQTKEFDVELANKFATMMKPYELRVDEKLHGYSIPVQPIINQLRSDLVAARAAQPPAAAGAPTPSGAPAAPSKEDQPQAGLTAKAGSGAEEENFDALFGTIGLSGLRF